ncbi:MAG: flavocytochrome c [Sutterellaceae bacterium]|nr:flavocytochrome c [Sutterellaceae bacterium]
MTADLSRRALLRTAGAAGVAAAASSAAFAHIPTKAPAKWDQTVDVLVVGTGFSGFSAAIEAKNAGADVLLIDKMPVIGGNSTLSGGGFAAPGSDMQKKAGIEDSAEQLYQDMLKAGGYINQRECAKAVAYGALDSYKWATEYLGVKWDRLGFHGGHSVARSCAFMNGSGANIIRPMKAKADELGIPVQLRTWLKEIIVDDNGAVIGAELRRGFRFPDEKSGKPVFVRVTRGLVMATGGFSQNVTMRMWQDPRLTADLGSTNHPGATGDGLLAAQRIGAGTTLMDWIQLGPWTSPDEKGFGFCPKFVESAVGYGLMVDPKTGKRFINETGNRKVRSDAIIATGHPAVLFVSEKNAAKHVPPAALKGGLENGSIKKFENLDALAAGYGIDAKTLKESVARWNEAIKAGKDKDFNAKIFKDTEVNEGVFYACRLWPRVHYCMGGMMINEKAEAISIEFKVIPGLFAAGEVCGGVHGMVRLGTVSIADCVIFGRIAGRSAAARKA